MGISGSEMQQLLSSSFCILVMLFFKAIGASQNLCSESKCGDDHGLAIHFPFTGGHDRGDQKMVLVKFFVKGIDYKHQVIQVYQPNDCLLLKPLEITNMPTSPFRLSDIDIKELHNYAFFHCPTLVERHTYEYDLYPVPCLGGPDYKTYAVDSTSDLRETLLGLQSCTKMYEFSVPFVQRVGGPKYTILHFKWSKPNCKECEAEGKSCRLKTIGIKSEVECVHLKKARKTKQYLAAGAALGSFVLLLLLIAVYRVYSADRKEKENRLKIEMFLADYKAHKPSRYSYADIKRITNHFKDKLGQGAYGTVFKGKLSSEFFVAVKVLNNSTGHGEEFINEVGTMCHIHHVNVARLVGFCADEFTRALVYEFFPNGSLQDFISSADGKNCFLGWEKLHDIAIGIAKGIDYLHQGCDQRILHFDIKPHNVLLDLNLTPKISDFGLAKLCSKDRSIVSMTTARGTLGYIAPEVFSRNFGNVSHKSDVYSFGMLLLEMVGGRKNIGSTTENTNEIYYPEWIYNLLEGGDDLRLRIGEDGDGKIPKKLAIVGLWCIQWHPVDRPSMKSVVQMLGEGENLTMPPNPFGSTRPTATNAHISARRFNLELEAIAEL